MNKISFSSLKLYNECGQKYYYKYSDNLQSPEIHSPLLFGVAIDEALNLMLELKRDGKEIDLDEIKAKFLKHLTFWGDIDTRFDMNVLYTLGDIDFYLLTKVDCKYFIDIDKKFASIPNATQKVQREYIKEFKELFREQFQYLAWTSLFNKGIAMIDGYYKEVLPLLTKIHDVQVHYKIDNGEGDILTVKMDFVADYEGKTIVFDNKTTSTPYPMTSVIESEQLATYLEFWDTEYAGYITMNKKIGKDAKVKFQIIVDKIPSEFSEQTFDKFVNGLYDIKRGIFNKNENACFAYGRRCEYWSLCKEGNMGNLIKRERK